MAKGFNRYNLLLRIKAVNERYLELDALGHNFTVIYRDYIYPEFIISRATLYNYLATPYQRELDKIDAEREKEKEIAKRQQRLFADE